MKHHFINLSPFYSVKLTNWHSPSLLLPEVLPGYHPNAKFIGSRSQCYEWIQNYFRELEESGEI